MENDTTTITLCMGSCVNCIHGANLSTDKPCNRTYEAKNGRDIDRACIDDAPDPISPPDYKRKPSFCKKCNNQGHFFDHRGNFKKCNKC